MEIANGCKYLGKANLLADSSTQPKMSHGESNVRTKEFISWSETKFMLFFID